MMTKKGIMVNFLLTVLLAIIIFVPACLGVSKLFRLSEQAENSFTDFTAAIEEAKNLAEQKPFLLIMDKETFIIGYSAQKNTELCTAAGDCGISRYPQACQGESCLCLCQKIKVTGFKAEGEDISCAQQRCNILEGVTFADGLTLNNFYSSAKMQEAPNLAGGYFRHGFIITRGDLEFSGLVFPFGEFRRQFFLISAQDKTIFLCKEEKGCKVVAELK